MNRGQFLFEFAAGKTSEKCVSLLEKYNLVASLVHLPFCGFIYFRLIFCSFLSQWLYFDNFFRSENEEWTLVSEPQNPGTQWS